MEKVSVFRSRARERSCSCSRIRDRRIDFTKSSAKTCRPRQEASGNTQSSNRVSEFLLRYVWNGAFVFRRYPFSFLSFLPFFFSTRSLPPDCFFFTFCSHNSLTLLSRFPSLHIMKVAFDYSIDHLETKCLLVIICLFRGKKTNNRNNRNEKIVIFFQSSFFFPRIYSSSLRAKSYSFKATEA